jgi:phage terminase small subunit
MVAKKAQAVTGLYLPRWLKSQARFDKPNFASMSDLTVKQRKFCLKYIETGSPSEAYRYAYDCENMNDDSIRVEGNRLLQNPAVSLRIEHLQELAQRRNEVTVDRVIAEYAKLAFLDIRKAFDGDGNLKPIHEMDDDTAAAIAGIEVDVKSTSVDGEALQTSKYINLN